MVWFGKVFRETKSKYIVLFRLNWSAEQRDANIKRGSHIQYPVHKRVGKALAQSHIGSIQQLTLNW